ncbi:MAG: hypothetical protein WCW46_03250, partial [Candidatus Paceibacterota bacterium]
MDKPLKFNGKKFISARRAADITGYTSDYVGQLCRAKKIKSKLVGRSWYVVEDEILDHKNKNLVAHKKTIKTRRLKKKSLVQKVDSFEETKEVKTSKNEVKKIENKTTIFEDKKAFLLNSKDLYQTASITPKSPVLSPISISRDVSAKKSLYYKDDGDLFPVLQKKFDIDSKKYVALESINEALSKPQKTHFLDKFAQNTAVFSAIVLLAFGFVFGKETFADLATTHFGDRVKAEIAFLYNPYVDKIEDSYNKFKNNFSNINQDGSQLASSIFSTNTLESFSGWIKDTGYKIIKPWLIKDAPILVNNKNNNQSVANQVAVAKTVFVAGSDRNYIDAQISELKKYFSTLPLVSTVAPNVNRYYITNQNDRIINDVSGNIRDSIAHIDGSTITNSSFSGSAISAGSGSFGSLAVSGLSTLTYASSTYASFITASTTNLSIGGSSFTSLLGSGLTNVGGALTISGLPVGGISLTKGHFLVGDDAGVAQATSSIFVSSTGRVGIGTTSPFAKLSVVGDAFITGNITGSNLTATGTLNVVGNTTLAQATTTNLAITAITNSLLKTNATGGVIGATAGVDYQSPLTSGVDYEVPLTFSDGLTRTLNNIAPTSGYNIPLTASTTNWNDFYTTPSNRITSGLNLAWNGNTLNFSSTTLNLTTGSFASNAISQWNNDAGFLTSATGLTSYDAWTHPAYGGSATTSLVTLENGFISQASSTISGSLQLPSLSNGSLAVYNGTVGSYATTTAGTGLTYSANSFNVNATQNITNLSNLTSNGFVKTTNSDGTLSIDTTTYQPSGTYLTTIGTGYASTTATYATFSTTTSTTNGLTSALTITASNGALTFTPTISGTLDNAGLTNSTISGVALGGTLNALTATDNTLTFSGSYTGANARTVGLNLGNANSWNSLQTFNYSSTTYGSFTTASTTNFVINGQSFNNLLGTGLLNTGSALTLDTTFLNTTANAYIHASTTIPKTYTNNTFTGTNTFNSTLTIGTLNGPLQANNGVVSATSSIGVLYGGTGLTTSPSYGNILVGNSSGGYTLTATTSLGLQSPLASGVDYEVPLTFSGGLTRTVNNIAPTTGYNIPLTASTTNWNDFYTTPSNRITSGLNLAWNGNTLNFSSTTLNLTVGSFASNAISQWNNDAGYLTSATGLTSYDAFTHPAYGGSATTSLLTLENGFISQASSTIVGSLNVSGNVGIGTTNNSSAKLTVNGGINLNNGTSNTIFFGSNGVAAPGNNSAGQKIQLWGTAGTVADSDFSLGVETNYLWFNTGNGYKWYTGSALTASLSSLGNFVTSGTGTFTGGQIALNNPTLNVVSFNSPTQAVPGYSSTGLRILLSRNSSDMVPHDSAIGLESNALWMTTPSGNSFKWYINSEEKAVLNTSGNFGIGTTSPYQKLSVAGNVIADSFIATTTATSTFVGGISTNL